MFFTDILLAVLGQNCRRIVRLWEGVVLTVYMVNFDNNYDVFLDLYGLLLLFAEEPILIWKKCSLKRTKLFCCRYKNYLIVFHNHFFQPFLADQRCLEVIVF